MGRRISLLGYTDCISIGKNSTIEPDGTIMGKWAKGQHLNFTDARERAQVLLKDCIQAKHEHIHSGKCVMIEGGSPDHACCTCHFWAGSINALEEVLMDFD